MELNLDRYVKDYKKALCKYMGDKRKTKENVGPLLNKMGDPVAEGTKKAEVLKFP